MIGSSHCGVLRQCSSHPGSATSTGTSLPLKNSVIAVTLCDVSAVVYCTVSLSCFVFIFITTSLQLSLFFANVIHCEVMRAIVACRFIKVKDVALLQ